MRRRARVASSLLHRFVSDGPLVGDVLEEYHRGRSRFWLWRQVLAAIAVRSVSDLREDRSLALKAFAVGGAILLRPLFFPPQWASSAMRQWAWEIQVEAVWAYPVLKQLGFVWLVVLDVAMLAPSFLIFLFSGWGVGRLVRPRLGIAVAFVVLVLCITMLQSLPIALGFGERVVHFPAYFVVLRSALPATLVLLGVLLVRREADQVRA